MEKQTIIFDTQEGKKHSVRFNTSQEDAAMDSIYVKRSALGTEVPRKIKITIEEVE